MLVVGIGTDIIEIERIRRVGERKGNRFLERVFTQSEISLCRRRIDPFPCLAARFAAKEAVLKALGTGLSGCSWKDVEVVRGGTGQPEVLLGGKAGIIARNEGIVRVMISISHDRGRAVAFALAVRGGKDL